jgi:hypothetical protein
MPHKLDNGQTIARNGRFGLQFFHPLANNQSAKRFSLDSAKPIRQALLHPCPINGNGLFSFY